tara:strand:+ start:420 stop:824 length:405 start_codon:yes stop_codon:yes gene_type:complete
MSENSTKWQRDNFSNKQILEYLSLLKIEQTSSSTTGAEGAKEYDEGWNEAIDILTDMFYSLNLSDREFGAMAFNKETEMFEHIGKEPEDARQLRLDNEKELKERADQGKLPEIQAPSLSALFEGANEYSIPLAD